MYYLKDEGNAVPPAMGSSNKDPLGSKTEIYVAMGKIYMRNK